MHLLFEHPMVAAFVGRLTGSRPLIQDRTSGQASECCATDAKVQRLGEATQHRSGSGPTVWAPPGQKQKKPKDNWSSHIWAPPQQTGSRSRPFFLSPTFPSFSLFFIPSRPLPARQSRIGLCKQKLVAHHVEGSECRGQRVRVRVHRDSQGSYAHLREVRGLWCSHHFGEFSPILVPSARARLRAASKPIGPANPVDVPTPPR